MAVSSQPQNKSDAPWMQPPAVRPSNCPPGLEYLASLDQVLCHQQVELLEVFTGFQTNNKYVMKNSMGQQMFFIFEDTDCCMRFCCGPNREFSLHVMDNNQQEVMRIHRPFVCMGGCCWCANCCGFEVLVEAPVGTVIGVVKQKQTACTFDFDVCDAQGNPHMEIRGPCCTCKCCSDVDFPIYSNVTDQEIGKISKQWTGLAKEWFTNADNFGINWPMDLDVNLKATLIGALFLIDFMAFEQQNNQ